MKNLKCCDDRLSGNHVKLFFDFSFLIFEFDLRIEKHRSIM